MLLKRTFLFLVVTLLLSAYGCADNKNSKANDVCSIKTSSLNNSPKIYVLVTQDVNPNEELITNLANDIRIPLLRQKLNAEIIHTESEAVGYGTLVSASILRAYRAGLAKRIEVEYRVNDLPAKTEVHRGFESIHSKFGYGKISIKLGELISDGVIKSTLRDKIAAECL